MENSRTNPKVDEFLLNAPKWREEFERLRRIMLDFPVTEELKWGVPCYTFQDKNIALIHGFKEYCAILFVKGALLRDAQGLLIQQTENVQAGRQMRFTGVQEIAEKEAVLKDYISEAIEVEKAGLEVPFKKSTEFVIPEEFQKKLEENPVLKTAFEGLTPGHTFCISPRPSKPKPERQGWKNLCGRFLAERDWTISER